MWKWARRLLAGIAVAVLSAAAIAYYLLSQGLPPRPALAGQLVSESLVSSGRERRWQVYVPTKRSPAAPLVVVLHGSMGSPASARIEDFGYDFDRIADRVGAVIAYPQGVGGHWNNAARVGPYVAKELQIDDVAFLHAMVEQLVSRYDLARNAVLVTGVSNGGAMVTRLALQSPGFARAYAVVSESLPTPENMAMAPSGVPVSILFLNGTEDPIVPWHGGEVVLWPVLASRGEVRSVDAALAYFRDLAEAQQPPQVEALIDLDRSDGSNAIRTTWVGPAGHRIVLIALQGGGHGAPHPDKRGMRLLGHGNRDFHAAEAIWEFFHSTAPPASAGPSSAH